MYKVVISIYGKTRPAVTVTADDPTVAVLKALDNLMHVPFEFESEGTTVIHYNPIVYIPRKEIKID